MFGNTNTLFNQTFNVLQKGLDCAVMRQNTISNNVANVNTPNYSKKEVSFESELHRALYGPQPIPASRNHPKHLRFKGEVSYDEVEPQIEVITETWSRNDMSNIDVNEEMANLAKNNLAYDGYITSMTRMMKDLKSVISKGGRV